MHVVSIQATCVPSFESGQGFAMRHTVASLVAACSSSAAANMAIALFKVIDAENRRSAVVTRWSSAIALTRHCCAVGIRSCSIVIVRRSPRNRSRVAGWPALPYGDSGEPV